MEDSTIKMWSTTSWISLIDISKVSTSKEKSIIRIILAFSDLLFPVKPVSVPHIGSLKDKCFLSLIQVSVIYLHPRFENICYLSSGGLQVWLTGASGGMTASSVSRRSNSLVFIFFWGRGPDPLSSLCRRRLVVVRIITTGDNIFTKVLTLYIFSSLDLPRQDRGEPGPETAPAWHKYCGFAPLSIFQ